MPTRPVAPPPSRGLQRRIDRFLSHWPGLRRRPRQIGRFLLERPHRSVAIASEYVGASPWVGAWVGTAVGAGLGSPPKPRLVHWFRHLSGSRRPDPASSLPLDIQMANPIQSIQMADESDRGHGSPLVESFQKGRWMREVRLTIPITITFTLTHSRASEIGANVAAWRSGGLGAVAASAASKQVSNNQRDAR
ncbi:hypothetical protein BO78DRAFT_422970 [Aspergillus sclerotiicarbonarius CBS 121057]|uniref:Uncharacterized protein n=1 Tax=Aspergillus sclerotiicarbonarius (strain CBS 121057 / IBT 28362) TaxID=1448318 RepID=A0A319DXU6_ASPSB|nr:hypothetical protein BO78DRAFT_422970 [Aspergillus sclerotiicarbonarius CBS 121057]